MFNMTDNTTTNNNDSGYRLANLAELEHAMQALLSLGEKSQAAFVKHLAELEQARQILLSLDEKTQTALNTHLTELKGTVQAFSLDDKARDEAIDKHLTELKHTVETFSLDEKAQSALIRLVTAQLESRGDVEDDGTHPVVVRDFSSVNEHQKVILVPTGTYRIPQGFLDTNHCIIGLPLKSHDYPTLLLEGETQEIVNGETSETTLLQVCKTSPTCKFMCVRLDALQHSILEIELSGNKMFSDYLMQVEYGENIDVLNPPRRCSDDKAHRDKASNNIRAMLGKPEASCPDDYGTFCIGRDWALAAYGTGFHTRGTIDQALDGFHEGSIKIIDAIFRPLVALGEKLDAELGLK